MPLFGKKTSTTPAEWVQQAAAFEKIMSHCQNTTGGGGGVSSGVQRLTIREKRIGAPTITIGKERMPGSISQGRISGKVADATHVDYDFFLRGSNVSYAANVAISELFRRVTSTVCSTEEYRSMARGWLASGGTPPPIPRLHVPKLFCCVDTSMGAFFARAKNAVEAKIPGWWTNGTKNGKQWCSMAIVQGIRCETVYHYADKNIPFPKTFNFRGHACALGVNHAIDMILGNGDRLQRPNMGNFFIDGYGAMIAIDCDSALPPKGSGPEQLWRQVVLTGGNAVQKQHTDTWPFLIDVAHFAPYTKMARKALQDDFDRMVSVMKSYKVETINLYCNQMTANMQNFVRASLLTFGVMKKMAPELRNWFHEDGTCSGNSLLMKINAVACL